MPLLRKKLIKLSLDNIGIFSFNSYLKHNIVFPQQLHLCILKNNLAKNKIGTKGLKILIKSDMSNMNFRCLSNHFIY